MKTLLTILITPAALLSLVALWRPASRALQVFVWLPKLLGGALAPVYVLLGAIAAAFGLARRDGVLAATGLAAAGLSGRFLADIPSSGDRFGAAFGPGWQEGLPAHLRPGRPGPRWLWPAGSQAQVAFERDVVLGQHPGSGRPLLADLWQPPSGVARSGLGLIFAHGSGWRVGDKDLGTRHFFRHLANQGHTILDVAYTLWPAAQIATMVSEINQAVLWMRENAPALGVNPERIVLMGGSAGGQLVLSAAYAPGEPAFKCFGGEDSTPVRGVIAFYPAVDFVELYDRTEETMASVSGPLDRAALSLMTHLFTMQSGRLGSERDAGMGALLGGTPDEIPDTYRLLSPISQVGSHCPPTLLLVAGDDVFELDAAAHRLHHELVLAGVPSILVEFPHAEHGFDLVLPGISPVVRAATVDVDRFLALLA
ncbi:MAG: alpha/beta hydrolase [Anaerolineae bacterium]|nr:alpha/beta hydrolase [Anaerolineae bacterium]